MTCYPQLVPSTIRLSESFLNLFIELLYPSEVISLKFSFIWSFWLHPWMTYFSKSVKMLFLRILIWFSKQ